MHMSTRNLYIGLISGTSMDGIDAALVDLNNHPQVLHTLFTPYKPQTQTNLQHLIDVAPNCNLDQLGALDYQIGEEFAATALKLIRQAGYTQDDIAAIGSHGQTARHHPNDGTTTITPYTLQIGDPNIIAERTGITTIADFRRRDMAAGGEGAPLLPIFHAVLLQDKKLTSATINIGGISNITVIDNSGSIHGFDIGPGNCLMNQWAQQHFNSAYDKNGTYAASGTSSPELLARLLDDPYFKQAHPKTTGPEYFNLNWLTPHITGLNLTSADILRTLTQLTAVLIAKTVNDHAKHSQTIYLCGGGVHNELLVSDIKNYLPNIDVQTTAALNIDPDFVEAAAFAWLAQQTLSGNTGNLPTVTGARKAVTLGGIYKA